MSDTAYAVFNSCIRTYYITMHCFSCFVWKQKKKIIEPFPRPNKNASAQPASIQLTTAATTTATTTDLNNCDIEYVQKPISSVLLKSHETNDTMQSDQMSNEAMKEKVTRELLETEENYVKLLSSLCIG